MGVHGYVMGEWKKYIIIIIIKRGRRRKRM